jgi:hypothetical protein
MTRSGARQPYSQEAFAVGTLAYRPIPNRGWVRCHGYLKAIRTRCLDVPTLAWANRHAYSRAKPSITPP